MKTIIKHVASGLTLAILAAAAALLLSPYLIDAVILPRLLQAVSPLEHQASISRLTPFALRGSARLFGAGQPVLSMPNLELTYSPGFLLHRRISSLTLDHATVHLGAGHPGLFGTKRSDTAADRTVTATLLPVLPATIESLILRECSVVYHPDQAEAIRLTVSGQLQLEYRPHPDSGYLLQRISGTLSLFDALTGQVTLSLEAAAAAFDLEAGLQLNPGSALDALLRNTAVPLRAEGTEATLSARLDPVGPTLREISLNGRLNGFGTAFESAPLNGLNRQQTVDYAVSGTLQDLHYSLGPLQLENPWPQSLELQGQTAASAGAFTTSGRVLAGLGQPAAGTTQLAPLQLDYRARFNDAATWRLEAETRFSGTLPTIGEGLELALENGRFTSSVSAASATIEASTVLEIERLRLNRDHHSASLSNLALAAAGHQAAAGEHLTLNGSIGELLLPGVDLRLRELRAKLPLSTARTPLTESGTLSVTEIALGGERLGSLTAVARQRRRSLQFEGTIEPAFEPGVPLPFQASASPQAGSARLDWHFGPVSMDSARLPAAFQLPGGLRLQAEIETEGSLAFANQHLAGSSRIQLNRGTLEQPEHGLLIDGIECGLLLPRLPEPVSAPNQRCNANKLMIGKLGFDDAAVTYQIEDQRTLFLEKARADWCSGQIESTSLRLSAVDPALDTTLYCSRLNLAELLNQFGLSQVEGEGTVSGRLPLKVSGEGIEFDDGFLFSTPGTGGIVRFADTDLLRQGIGSAAGGGYLEYSLQALEDFFYNWTKLSFTSSDGELLLSMQLDGKPRRPLPYRLQDNGMVRTDQGTGIQYPIRLDVNFRLPLNDLFEIGRNINAIRENR